MWELGILASKLMSALVLAGKFLTDILDNRIAWPACHNLSPYFNHSESVPSSANSSSNFKEVRGRRGIEEINDLETSFAEPMLGCEQSCNAIESVSGHTLPSGNAACGSAACDGAYCRSGGRFARFAALGHAVLARDLLRRRHRRPLGECEWRNLVRQCPCGRWEPSDPPHSGPSG